MFQIFMDKQFVPVLVAAVATLLILLFRPSFLIKNSDSDCPYCIRPYLTSLVVLASGGLAYYFMLESSMPKMMTL